MGGLKPLRSGGNATFLRIGIGKDEKGRENAVIGKGAKKGDPGAVQVFKFDGSPALDKNDNPVYRIEYGAIEGRVVKIERAQPEFNGVKVDVLNIHFDTGDDMLCLQLGVPTPKKSGDYWLDFALRCADIDWSKDLTLTPYSIPQEDNPKFSNRLLVPSQGGQKIKRKWMIAWHKENTPAPEPEPGHPPAYIYDHEEGEWKRKKVWNWLDQNPIQMAIDKVEFLNMTKAELEKKDAQLPPDPSDTPPSDEPDPDDLPF